MRKSYTNRVFSNAIFDYQNVYPDTPKWQFLNGTTPMIYDQSGESVHGVTGRIVRPKRAYLCVAHT
jgi:hypothetical protein